MQRISSAVMMALMLQAGCAHQDTSELREQLDERTGVTLTRMGDALEFYAASPEAGLDSSSFAFVGALEVNRMGVRKLFLWVSTLAGGTAIASPARAADTPLRLHVLADAVDIEPEFIASDPSLIGLSEPPYERPASWTRDAYFDVSAEQLRTMRDAGSLALTIDDAAGHAVRFELWAPDRTPLTRFVDRLIDSPTR